MSTKDQILEKLKKVEDPEIPVNIVDLGLIYEIEELEEGSYKIEMTLTSMGCPTADAILSEVENFACKVDGVDNAEAELVYDPPWDKSKMSEEGKAKINAMGIRIPEY